MKPQMTNCRYCVQRLKETDGTAAERESGDFCPTENGEHGRRFRTETEEIPPVESTRSVKREAQHKKRCQSSARVLRRMHYSYWIAEREKKVENIF